MDNKPSLPFTTRALKSGASSSAQEIVDLGSLLPTSHRNRQDHIVAPQIDDADSFFARELRVDRLDSVRDWLWVCGRPMPPRPLHHQVLIGRDVTITESPELHLVWHKSRIFLKPLPKWLLDPDVWARHLLSASSPSSSASENMIGRNDESLAACARGFLFSYTALIAYESDFRIALTKGLIPHSVTWDSWRQLTREYLEGHCYASVNPRYWYGELRLSRLNKVYRFARGYLFRGYSKVDAHTVYVDLLRDNFGVLATILGYVVIVLSAMQVGLGVDKLQSDSAFQSASYGFTIFSILAPLVAGAGIVGGVLAMVVSNWLVTKDYERRRFNEMGVEPYWRSKPSKKDVNPSTKGYDSVGSRSQTEI
ncbi:glycosyltransferase family 28 domain-containing protein [Apiospora arundinis]|uniref:Glycosyltransferase family 28 domain-containing protein n=1 Tax=Apiospora arundinis TaxID=335852 RepID=A0ABR2HY17_9PEZI